MNIPFVRREGTPVLMLIILTFLGLIALVCGIYIEHVRAYADQAGISLSNNSFYFSRFFLLLLAAVGLISGLFGGEERTRLDETGLTHTVRTLWGTKTRVTPLSDIVQISVREERGNDGPDGYVLTIKLKSGRGLKFFVKGVFSDAWTLKRDIEDFLGMIPD